MAGEGLGLGIECGPCALRDGAIVGGRLVVRCPLTKLGVFNEGQNVGELLPDYSSGNLDLAPYVAEVTAKMSGALGDEGCLVGLDREELNDLAERRVMSEVSDKYFELFIGLIDEWFSEFSRSRNSWGDSYKSGGPLAKEELVNKFWKILDDVMELFPEGSSPYNFVKNYKKRSRVGNQNPGSSLTDLDRELGFLRDNLVVAKGLNGLNENDDPMANAVRHYSSQEGEQLIIDDNTFRANREKITIVIDGIQAKRHETVVNGREFVFYDEDARSYLREQAFPVITELERIIEAVINNIDDEGNMSSESDKKAIRDIIQIIEDVIESIVYNDDSGYDVDDLDLRSFEELISGLDKLQARYCTLCGVARRVAGDSFVCEGCGSTDFETQKYVDSRGNGDDGPSVGGSDGGEEGPDDGEDDGGSVPGVPRKPIPGAGFTGATQVDGGDTESSPEALESLVDIGNRLTNQLEHLESLRYGFIRNTGNSPYFVYVGGNNGLQAMAKAVWADLLVLSKRVDFAVVLDAGQANGLTKISEFNSNTENVAIRDAFDFIIGLLGEIISGLQTRSQYRSSKT